MSDEKRTWYQRTHQFTPYTKADGTAVSDEFDAIQASFERIPAMRDDGKGFATSPLIPEPSNPYHPVPFKMLTETEASVNNARDDVTEKAQQVAHDAQAVATNTQTTINQAKSASQSAESASASSRSASDSEDMARKWASNPVNQTVADNKYSAYHYSVKASEYAANLSVAEHSAKSNAESAAENALIAQKAAKKAESLSYGEIEYSKVLHVPQAGTDIYGITRLTSELNLDDERLALTAKAGKTLSELIERKQSPAKNLAGYGIQNFKIESFHGDANLLKTDGIYAIAQPNISQNLPTSNACHIQVIAGNDGRWCHQIAYIAYSSDIYQRFKSDPRNETWSPWTKIGELWKSMLSNSVNDESEEKIATSYAVKTAYDKGVNAENAANSAQQAVREAKQATDDVLALATNANNNANGRVSKSGDTMTGNLTVPNIIVNDPTNNNNSVQIGDDTKLIDVDMGHTVGLQATDNANDAYIAYGATKKRFGFDGVNFTAESGLGAQWFGSQKRGEGTYVNQWRTEAPYHVQAGNANGSNTYFPYLKGKVTNGDGWGSAFSFGYATPGARNQFGAGIIHLIEDNGSEKKWRFEHNGNFSSAADVVTGSGKSLNDTHQQSYDYVQVTSSTSYGGLSILKPDGKSMRFERQGNAFKFWCQDMYSILMPERGGTVLLDTDFSHATNGTNKGKVASEFALGELYKQTVTDIRLGALATRKLGSGSWTSHGNGYVVVGFENGNWDALHASDNIHLRPIQKKVNGQWVTISNV